MAGSASDDRGIERSSEGFLEFLSGQHCQSGEALAEWRLSEQVDNGTPSTSPPYWDTDEDDDGGPKPSELYGRYTWKIEKFSQTSKRELKSEVFDVGGYKWYILIYPQGCDVCNHLSLFLCVANHDKLLPGWSHFAQFTIAVVNKDPKKSKYSDTLHRFWKKEHDWGWKKFMELTKVQEGFIVADTLEIRAQVQIIREKAHRPFRCLDRQYRRELVRVYLTNVEQICRRLVEERRAKLGKLIDDKVRWLSFYTFWLGVDQSSKDCMSREKTDVIMRVVVKHLFVEKEVTSTLVMDSLNSGLKALEAESKRKRGKSNLLETGETPAPFISVEDDTFVLADDVLILLERAANEPLPPKDDKGPQNRTKEGNSGEDFNKDSIERDERCLTELGRKTIETFVLAHIYSKKIEVAYQECVALKRQEELIREEEAAGQAEIEQKAKRRAAEKEKRSKKKMNKQKRSNRKGKDRGKDEKFDMEVQETHQSSLINERIEETYSLELAQSMPEKDIAFEAVSDVTDVDDDLSETVQLDIEDRHASSVNWDADTSEALPSMELCGRSSLPIENGNAVTSPSSMDDSSSTCSTDSAPSVIINGSCKSSSFTNYRTQKSPNREKNQGATETHEQINRFRENNTLLHDPTTFTGNGNASARSSNSDEPELKAVLCSRDQIQKFEQHMIKKDASVSSQLIVKDQANIDRPSKQMTAAEALSFPRDPTRNITPLLQSKSVLNGNTTSVSVRELSSTKLPQNDTLVTPRMQLPQNVAISQPEVKKNISLKPVGMPADNSTSNYAPVRSRPPSSAPIVSDPRPTAPMVSMAQTAPMVSIVQPAPMVSMAQSAPMAAMVQTAPITMVQTAPSLSWSASAAGRLDSDSKPAIQSSNPHQSYRGSGTANTLAAHMPGLLPTSSLVASPLLYPQPPALALSFANSNLTDHGLATSGFTFGSVTPEVLHNQSQWIEASQGSSSTTAVGSSILNVPHNFDSYRAGNSGLRTDFTDQFSTSVSSQQAQRASLDEFPHLDIINYLFDEELGNGNEANGSTVSVGPSSAFHQHLGHQFIFPNDMSTLVEVGSTINGHFEQPMAYYDDEAQPVYGAFTNHTNGLTDVALPVDFSIYGNGHYDGMIQNQWPVGYGSNLCLVSDGYPFHMPEYPNLACGVGGYAVFQPSSGH